MTAWTAALVAIFLTVLGAASAGSSDAAGASRTTAVHVRTLVESRLQIRAFAQDGGRIAWISPKREHGRPAGCALRIRDLRNGRTTVTLLGRAGCPDQNVWQGALALAGRSAAWVAGAYCGNSECSWSVMRATEGDSHPRRVDSADIQCGITCEWEGLQPLLAGAGRLLAYSYVTLGRVQEVAARGLRSLFATTGDIRGLAAGGGRVAAVSLTLGGGCGCLAAPTWSPDGTKVAVAHGTFSEFSDANPNVAVMNADGTGLHDLPSSKTRPIPAWGIDIAWSPDGRRIAYEDSWPRIWVVNADGSDAHPLTEGTRPAWSPDGSKIAFEGTSGNTIYVMNPDGSDIQKLTDVGTGTAGIGPFAWSPDGSRIAISVGGALEVMNADGSNLHPLDGAAGDQPTWSPDGSRIAFRSRDGLFVIGADGAGLRRLTSRMDSHPSWSPAANTIVFARSAFATIDGRELIDLYALDLDSGNLRAFGPAEPVRVESKTVVRSPQGLTTLSAVGAPAGLALADKLAAVGSLDEGVDRITVFKAATGKQLATVQLGEERRFSVGGADAHWIVFHVRKTISALKIGSREIRRLATATMDPLDLSVSGRRVAWLERLPSGRFRIRALDLPS